MPRSLARRPPRSPAVGRLQHGRVSTSGAPNAIWWFRHSTRSMRAPGRGRAWPPGCRCPRRRARRSAPVSRSALAPSRPVNGSSSSRRPASCTSARAISTRWRCPPDSSPNGRPARSASPTRSSASGAAALGPAWTAPPRQPRQRAHHRDVERGHGVVEPRALGLRHVAAARRELELRRHRLELAQQRAEEGGLAAAVRAQHASARPGRTERDAGDRRPAVVARRQIGGRDERHPMPSIAQPLCRR